MLCGSDAAWSQLRSTASQCGLVPAISAACSRVGSLRRTITGMQCRLSTQCGLSESQDDSARSLHLRHTDVEDMDSFRAVTTCFWRLCDPFQYKHSRESNRGDITLVGEPKMLCCLGLCVLCQFKGRSFRHGVWACSTSCCGKYQPFWQPLRWYSRPSGPVSCFATSVRLQAYTRANFKVCR